MNLTLSTKPDAEEALQRVAAWFEGELLDRPPVRFSAHNADFSGAHALQGRAWPDLKARWFDAEFQVEFFREAIRGRKFYGETFPVFWPNLGPNVYAAFHGCELEFGEVTSWIQHPVSGPEDLAKLRFSRDNEYFRGIEELTRAALEVCGDEFLVGYTDLHGSLDCLADWRNPQELCIDLMDDPDFVRDMLALANANFLPVYDHFDARLKAAGQLSVTWMGIPSRGKMHIPSCDFSTLISTDYFREFFLPSMLTEVRHMTHNIFHLDGKGLLRHLDTLLEVPEIHAIQWVQGVGDDQPILQWLPVIHKIQAAGKGVIVDLQPSELDDFMAVTRPEGIFLCLAAAEENQPALLEKIKRWAK
jgi:hypothetical protein